LNVQPETRFAESAEGHVGYQVFGDGPIDLLFGTPWAWNIEVMWEQPRIERFFVRLASFARVIVFDKRGTGVSDSVPLGALPTLEQWTDDIRVVLDDIGVERAAIVGTSESSPMAMVFAASHPERASALVVINGWASGLRKDDYPAGLPPELAERAVEVMTTAPTTRWGPAQILFPSEAHDEAFIRWMGRFMRLSAPPASIERMFSSGMNWDIRSVLPAIRVPTLILHRSGDRYIWIGHGHYLAEHIPGATFVEVPGDDSLFFVGDTGPILEEIQAFLTGSRGMPEVDRVLATVLFTDIVGSTDLAATVGDRRWREVLDEHELISRREVERFRGRFVNTTGDGVLATFDGPGRAIRCARSLIEGVGSLGIQLRAGLHTGEVELRGTDLGGIAMHIGARVAALAGQSEVLVSSTVKDLVAGSEIEFEDRGTHQLKGVPDEWRLFAVTG
jgi:class 3 adenylate cyclase